MQIYPFSQLINKGFSLFQLCFYKSGMLPYYIANVAPVYIPEIMNEAFIDLDELVAYCRDKLAKKFIQEAVACYRAGAYRSCIVATWNATVFDFLHKLRELELLGNGEATSLLQKFEKLSADKKVKELWQFEKDIPTWALEKFELLSHPEKSQIERLFEDRSLCAHPSMASLEEPFEATAELARCHLRSAVMYLLQRPPVQGRSARDRIFQDIQSEYFPTDPERAAQYLQKSPLARARLNLIKDIVLGLTVSLLTEERLEDERMRQFSALNAISSLYHKETREILNDRLSDIVLGKVTDANWNKVIIYLGSVKAWDKISEPCQIKAMAFIEKLAIFDTSPRRKLSLENVNVLLNAARLEFLKKSVAKQLQLPFQELILLKEFCKNELKDKSIHEFIRPLLEENISHADLDDLIAMRSDGNDSLNEKIAPYLAEKIRGASLRILVNIRLKDDSLDELVEPILQKKIHEASLTEMLEVLYWATRTDREDIMSKFENPMMKLMSNMNLDSLIKIKFELTPSNELFDNLFKSLLRRSPLVVTDKFTKSSTYRTAEFNVGLLAQVSDLLSFEQWETVLEAFCENSQVYDSFCCPSAFCTLFEESVKRDGFVQRYWFSFREKLNKFSSHEYIDKLKYIIDSNLEANLP